MEGHRRYEKRLVWGILFMVAGAAILAANMNMIPWAIEEYLFTWQALLILIGLVLFAVKANKTGGIIMMAVGGFFMIEEYHFLPYNLEKFYWPAILILIGLAIIFQRDRFDQWKQWKDKKNDDNEISG